MKVEILPRKNCYPDHLIKVALDYIDLEKRIRSIMHRLFEPFCEKCSNCCCKEDICRESIDSAWLTLVRNILDSRTLQYNEADGWLSSSGCRLAAGRPPVCYEYLCTNILNSCRGCKFLDNLKQLSKLLSITGTKSLGHKHLVALSTEEIATRLNPTKLSTRISNSNRSFERINKEFISLYGCDSMDKVFI
jgi:hypothetical protein